MIKLLDFAPVDKYGEPTIKIIPRDKVAGVKLASVDGAYAPEIREFMQQLKPVVGKIYALINAMGATEYFGCNRNGDAFFEDALKKYHHTFVEDGHAFMHHKNKDPEKSYGKVVFSAYNDKMHRVELVVEYDTTKLDPKFVDKINNGDMVNVSMGCRVDSDYCSICGHRAKTPADYCKHLKYEPGLTKMLPDGRKAFAINKDPHFFDISIVTIPADPTARVMAKLASNKNEVISSVTRAAEELGNEKTAAEVKVIDMNKDDGDSKISDIPAEEIGDILDSLLSDFDHFMGPSIPRDILNTIGRMSHNPLPLLSGFIKKKIFLRPHETQRIILVSSGKENLADALDKAKTVVMDDPKIGLREFAKCNTCFDGVEALPSLFEDSRTLNDDLIKKITVRIVAGDEDDEGCQEKLSGIRPVSVDYSDDFKYLMGQTDVESASGGLLPFLKDSSSAILVMGSVISAFNALLGGNLSADFVKGVGLGSLIGGPKLINSITDNLKSINTPVQEMRFMNTRTPEAVEAALSDALVQASLKSNSIGKLASCKYAFSAAPINAVLPKALLSVPLAYGASKLIQNEAKKDAIEEAGITGKYNPGLLSKSSVTFPLALAAIMKFASANKVADTYVKTAKKHGLTKKQIYSKLSDVLFNKNC